MTKLKVASIALALFTAVVAGYELYRVAMEKDQPRAEVAVSATEIKAIKREIERTMRAAPERRAPDAETEALAVQLQALERAAERVEEPAAMPAHHSYIVLIGKLCFSLLFGVAALFVILSRRYPEDTEKWAFSVLSLISGVWIGTVS